MPPAGFEGRCGHVVIGSDGVPFRCPYKPTHKCRYLDDPDSVEICGAGLDQKEFDDLKAAELAAIDARERRVRGGMPTVPPKE